MSFILTHAECPLKDGPLLSLSTTHSKLLFAFAAVSSSWLTSTRTDVLVPLRSPVVCACRRTPSRTSRQPESPYADNHSQSPARLPRPTLLHS